MARIIATEKPLIMQKKRQLEISHERWLMANFNEREDITRAFTDKEKIPSEVLPSYTNIEEFDSATLTWEWWEVTV